jgi:uncharacterized Zn-binding protein involved in type VI secretion
MRRRLGLLVFLFAVGLGPEWSPAPVDLGCPLASGPDPSWTMALPITEALAQTNPGPTKRRDGTPTLDDLDGDWDGTAIMSGASSPMKQVEAAVAPYLGITHEMHGDALLSSGGLKMAFRSAKGSLWSCLFAYSGTTLTCSSTVNGYAMTMTGSVSRTTDALRIAGTWTASQPMITLRGSWALSKAANDVEIELLYPSGKSPKVFVTGWPFGARCIQARGSKAEKDLSSEVEWSGTATFEPGQGERTRPHFAHAGSNRITLACGGAKKSFAIETVRTTFFARQGDTAENPADAHGCPACPHPTIGPIVMGSPDVSIDGRPAARVGDFGIHAACCGPNQYRIRTGSAEVLINGKPAAILGSETTECGGSGTITTASPGGNEPDGPPESSGGFFGMPAAPTQQAPRGLKTKAPAAAKAPPPLATAPGPEWEKPSIMDARDTTRTTFETGRAEVKVVRNTAPGGRAPTGSIAVLPDSRIVREPDGSVRIEKGGAVVTTLGGAKQLVNAPEGRIELGSQARIARLTDGVDVALLAGRATITPANGSPFPLVTGQHVRFTKTGPLAPPTTMSAADVAESVARYVNPSAPAVKDTNQVAVGRSFADVPMWAWATGGALGILVLAGGIVSIAIVSRRKKPPPPPYAGPSPSGALPTGRPSPPSQPAQQAQPPQRPSYPSQPAQQAQPPQRPSYPSQPAQQAQPPQRPSYPSQPAQQAQPPQRPSYPSQPAQQAQPPQRPSYPSQPAQQAQPPQRPYPSQPAQPPQRPSYPSQPAQQAQPPQRPSYPSQPGPPGTPPRGRPQKP